MRINVAATPAEFDGADGSTAVVVIDVFRAATTITTALANGARFILPTTEVEQAVRLLEPYGENEAVLGGERDGRRIDGFHLGNSPREYSRDAVANKVVILTTTNGTRALSLTGDAGAVFVGCFLNAGRLATELTNWSRVTLICAGNSGRLNLEDWVCAGSLVARLTKTAQTPSVTGEHELTASRPRGRRSRYATLQPNLVEPTLDDGAYAAWAAYLAVKSDMAAMLRSTEHARYLIELGFGPDLDVALRVDSVPVVPHLADGRIVPLPDRTVLQPEPADQR